MLNAEMAVNPPLKTARLFVSMELNDEIPKGVIENIICLNSHFRFLHYKLTLSSNPCSLWALASLSAWAVLLAWVPWLVSVRLGGLGGW